MTDAGRKALTDFFSDPLQATPAVIKDVIEAVRSSNGFFRTMRDETVLKQVLSEDGRANFREWLPKMKEQPLELRLAFVEEFYTMVMGVRMGGDGLQGVDEDFCVQVVERIKDIGVIPEKLRTKKVLLACLKAAGNSVRELYSTLKSELNNAYSKPGPTITAEELLRTNPSIASSVTFRKEDQPLVLKILSERLEEINLECLTSSLQEAAKEYKIQPTELRPWLDLLREKIAEEAE